jgi:hypothetical protein
MHLNRITFAAGLAIGFVAGTRAGRERYDQMVKMAKQAKESPAFQQAAATAQSQATGLLNSAGKKVGETAPRLAQSAMHSVGDRIPLIKQHNGAASADGKNGKNGKGGKDSDRPAAAAGHSSVRSADK